MYLKNRLLQQRDNEDYNDKMKNYINDELFKLKPQPVAQIDGVNITPFMLVGAFFVGVFLLGRYNNKHGLNNLFIAF